MIRRVPGEDFCPDGRNRMAAEVERVPVDRFESGHQRRVVFVRVERAEGHLNLLDALVQVRWRAIPVEACADCDDVILGRPDGPLCPICRLVIRGDAGQGQSQVRHGFAQIGAALIFHAERRDGDPTISPELHRSLKGGDGLG